MKIFSVLRYSLAILLGAAVFALPQAATAAPQYEKLTVTVLGPPADRHIDLAAGLACPGFPVHVDLTKSKTQTKVFTNTNGEVVRTFQSGDGYVRTYINATTKRKVTFPSEFFTEDTTFNLKTGLRTVTNTGHFGLIMFPTDVPAGPSITEYEGKVVYTATPTDDFVIKRTQATKIDVCAKLARK